MTGGLIQLVAYGVEDIFLTKDPQITYFKVVYRRHTNFSIEMMTQQFSNKGNFGKKVSATISRAGDLIHRMYLLVTLPKVPKFFNDDSTEDKITKFAWTRRIGYALIRSIEIDIGGQIIDKHYGDWLNIWHELGIKQTRGLSNLIGDLPEVYNFSNGKNKYELCIPINFWFCRTIGLALPIICLQYSEVRINVEFNDLDKCQIIGPTHYIKLDDDLVNFAPYEYISQTIDQQTTHGQFMYFDIEDKKLYYNKISGSGFYGLTYTSLLDDATTKSLVRDDNNKQYMISGSLSGVRVIPGINEIERVSRNNTIRGLSLRNTSILVEYIYLDEDERKRFAREKHEYLIEQVQYTGQKTIDSSSRSVKMGFQHPCKEIIWVLQKQSYIDRNDHFNYTDSFKWDKDRPVGLNNIKRATVMINGIQRQMENTGSYYNWVQSYQHHKNSPMEGINCYSFALEPENLQPSGSCNLSKIDNFNLDFITDTHTNFDNLSKFRGYGLGYNILRIAHGLCGLVFIDQ